MTVNNNSSDVYNEWLLIHGYRKISTYEAREKNADLYNKVIKNVSKYMTISNNLENPSTTYWTLKQQDDLDKSQFK